MFKVSFKASNYWLAPLNIDFFDMNFNICEENGTFLGTVVTGIQRRDLFTEEHREELQTFLEVEAQKIEARMKFEKEFKIQLEKARQLNISEAIILETMYTKYHIPVAIMNKVLKMAS